MKVNIKNELVNLKKNEYDKEIYKNLDNNKYYLIQKSENNHNKHKNPQSTCYYDKECNLYGQNLTSFQFFDNRKPYSIQSLKENMRNYIPITSKFDGYFQFPSPRENIFYNKDINIKSNLTKKELRNYLDNQKKLQFHMKNIYSDEQYEKFIKNKERTVGFLNLPAGYENLIKINNKNGYSLPKIIKNRIDYIDNSHINISGKYDNEKKYLINAIKHIKNNKSYTIYRKIVSENKNKNIKESFLKEKSNMNSYTLNKSKIPIIIPGNLNKNINNNKNYKNNTINTTNITNTTNSNDINEKLTLYNNTFFNKITLYKKPKDYDTISEKSKDSYQYKEEMNKTAETLGMESTNNITYFNVLKKTYSDKKEFYKIKKDEKGKEKIIVYKDNKEIQTEFELYLKERELFKKVNSIAINVQEEKDELDKRFFMKKLEMRRIKKENI